jgi:dipeptidyl aminopeptidase/acylaminoacyl peptidase
MVRLFSLEKQVNKHTPPTFILHARDDQAVPPQNTKAYAEALKTNSIKAETIFLPEGGHGFGFREDSPAFIWTKHLEEWLNKIKKANGFKTD